MLQKKNDEIVKGIKNKKFYAKINKNTISENLCAKIADLLDRHTYDIRKSELSKRAFTKAQKAAMKFFNYPKFFQNQETHKSSLNSYQLNSSTKPNNPGNFNKKFQPILKRSTSYESLEDYKKIVKAIDLKEKIGLFTFHPDAYFNTKEHLMRCISFGNIQESTFLATLALYRKYLPKAKVFIKNLSSLKLFITCLYVCHKLVEDKSWMLSDFSLLVGLPRRSLKEMEIILMVIVNFDISTSNEDLNASKDWLYGLKIGKVLNYPEAAKKIEKSFFC